MFWFMHLNIMLTYHSSDIIFQWRDKCLPRQAVFNDIRNSAHMYDCCRYGIITIHTCYHYCNVTDWWWSEYRVADLGRKWPKFIGRWWFYWHVLKFVSVHIIVQKMYLLNLTHSGWDKMDAISQTAFSSAFYLMKMYELPLKIPWSLF